MARWPALFVVLLAPGGGCDLSALTSPCAPASNPYFMDDAFGWGAPYHGCGNQPDELSLPYASGATVQISGKVPGGRGLQGWTVQSSAPAVFSCDRVSVDEKDPEVLVAACSAHAEGEASIRLVDVAGGEIHRAPVKVVTPDRARVLSHGTLRLLGVSEAAIDAAEIHEARVLSGSVGVYGVVFQRGTQRLYGRGILAADAPKDLGIEVKSAPAFGNDWMFVSPRADGSYTVTLRSGGAVVGMLPVTAVSEPAIAALTLREETNPQREAETWILARAADGTGRTIDGVYCEWTLAGTPQVGSDDPSKTRGDLLRYTEPSGGEGPAATVVAKHGALSATLEVHASKASVYDTTYLGCAVGGRRGGAGMVGWALAALLLVLLRRRRG